MRTVRRRRLGGGSGDYESWLNKRRLRASDRIEKRNRRLLKAVEDGCKLLEAVEDSGGC